MLFWYIDEQYLGGITWMSLQCWTNLPSLSSLLKPCNFCSYCIKCTAPFLCFCYTTSHKQKQFSLQEQSCKVFGCYNYEILWMQGWNKELKTQWPNNPISKAWGGAWVRGYHYLPTDAHHSMELLFPEQHSKWHRNFLGHLSKTSSYQLLIPHFQLQKTSNMDLPGPTFNPLLLVYR